MGIKDTLLIVDDLKVNRAILCNLFQNKYNLLEAENGEEALAILRNHQNKIEAVLLDLVMPKKDGYEVMEEMQHMGILTQIPVIIISSDSKVESEVKALDMGASDMLLKPFKPRVVERRVQNIIELNRYKRHLEELVEQKSLGLRKSNTLMIDVLSNVIEYRSLESGQHIRRIRMFIKILLEKVAEVCPEYELDLHKIEIIVEASSMHDIGKIAIPDAILNKPGALTKEEFEIMKTHTSKGYEILRGLERLDEKEYLQYAYSICRYHHERWNGCGYPDGLKGDNIPICAQVAGIADCYDALTTNRVYKKAFSSELAYEMILGGECGAFSQKLLNCFAQVKNEFAALQKKYADGTRIKPEYEIQDIGTRQTEQEHMDFKEELKARYDTILRYNDATAMEVDVNTGKFRLAYVAEHSFESLTKENYFEEAMQVFVDTLVYSEDKETVLEILDDYMTKFLDEGLMKETRRYRIYHPIKEKYCWHTETLLRVDMDNPRQKKVMIIWKEINITDMAEEKKRRISAKEELVRGMLNNVQQCVNDKWLTIIQNNGEFLESLGYTVQDVEERFHNHFIEMIYPADRMKVLGQWKNQLHVGRTLELEYRIIAKDGSIIWILAKCQMYVEEDEKEYICGIHSNITELKNAQEALRAATERYEIVQSQTNDVVFEWNIAKDELKFSNRWKEIFGYLPITENVQKEILKSSHIYSEDLGKVKKVIEEILAGESHMKLKLRILGKNGEYEWHKIRITAQLDELGKPFQVIGVILNIV
ncbi:MAG: PAS domain-containing protein [Lachnospiraceae bacterium]